MGKGRQCLQPMCDSCRFHHGHGEMEGDQLGWYRDGKYMPEQEYQEKGRDWGKIIIICNISARSWTLELLSPKIGCSAYVLLNIFRGPGTTAVEYPVSGRFRKQRSKRTLAGRSPIPAKIQVPVRINLSMLHKNRHRNLPEAVSGIC